MDLLTAVNTILPWMEENTVTTVETKHPTVAMILQRLDSNREKILTESYWFNTETKKFYLTPTGEVMKPTNLLEFYPKDKALNYEVRGDRVYDLSEGTYQIKAPFEATIKVDLEFHELPEAAARTVMWRSAIDVYVPDFGVDNSVQILMQREAEAFALLQREHLRKVNYSAMRSRPGMRFLNALRT